MAIALTESFETTLNSHGWVGLRAHEVTTLQVNIGKFCNQVCRHCHVDAGPHRLREQMSRETAELVVRVLRDHPSIKSVDVTGGAPELNPNFRYMVDEATEMKREVIDRCNLTVLFVSGQEDLVGFLADHRVRVIASLPCYLEQNADKQRGNGVFQQSIDALQRLNAAGYGRQGSGLELDLIYNPLGPILPPPQAALEADYKRELKARYGVVFNRLYTITNMPIARFRVDLEQAGRLDKYMELLEQKFNPAAVHGVMCRSMVSVSWDGRLFDCDFNQMLEIPLADACCRHIRDFDLHILERRRICTGKHCFGCTAGAGSSCTGALKEAV